MLKEMEYMGFAMKFPDEGVLIHVFDVVPDGIKRYGPYKLQGHTEKYTSLNDASIITISFEDGTMPIPLGEFDARVHAGETWNNNEYNIFTKIHPIGTASLISRTEGKKVALYKVMMEEGKDFYLTMFNQCAECVARMEKSKTRKVTRKLKKATAIYTRHLDDMGSHFTSQDAYATYKDLIIDILDEAYNVADKALVDFILQENEKLAKKGVPPEKRSARIARATAKKCEDEFWAESQKKPSRNKKGGDSVQ